MKSILISIKPKWVAKILNGEKTIEVRKTAPKCELPITVYVYCTKDKNNTAVNMQMFFDGKDFIRNGKVVAKFTLRKVEEIKYLLTYGYVPMSTRYSDEPFWKRTCLTYKEILGYGKGKTCYGWHISDLEIFDEPKELGEFGLAKAPQSWAYIRED